MSPRLKRFSCACVSLLWMTRAMSAQPGPSGTKNGEWPSYTADLNNDRYSPLDQINASNFNKLEVAWRFKTDNLGPRPEFKLEGTPLMVKGVLYTTAGTRRSVVALDAKTGELIWVAQRARRQARRAVAPRQLSGRGVSYWTDGKGDDRILYVTTGYRLVALNAKTGALITSFGTDGIVDLKEGVVLRQPASRSISRPARSACTRRRPSSRTSSSSARRSAKARRVQHAQQHQGSRARVRRAHRQAALDVQHDSAPGRVRQRHVGERLVGGQRQHRRVDADHGRRRARPRLSAGRDADVGLLRRPSAGQQPVRRKPGLRRSEDRPAQVALPVRAPSDLELRHVVGADPGRHHRRTAAPSRRSRRRASRRCLYVFDRVTGQPVWPIEERPVPQSDVPGEKTSPTQPFPTKPPAYARQGVSLDDLIDFTPELRAEAVKLASRYKFGRCYAAGRQQGRRSARGAGAAIAAGGTNWPGAAYDPETHIVYAYAQETITPLGLVRPPDGVLRHPLRHGPRGSDLPRRAAERPAKGSGADIAAPRAPASGGGGGGGGRTQRSRAAAREAALRHISAINLDNGEIVWQVPHGETPDAVRNNPRSRG